MHDAVNSGRLEELHSLLEEEPDKKKKIVAAKDEAGVGLLHKAVYYELKDIYKYLINNFPHIVHLKDSVIFTGIKQNSSISTAYLYTGRKDPLSLYCHVQR